MDILKLIDEKKLVIFDGAMGTQLEMRGAPAGGLSNIKAPDTVVEVQRAYIDSGSNAIIANTFCMCRIYADTHKINDDFLKINRLGVELAKKAAGGDAVVLGDIGPTGQMLRPMGEYTEEQFYETFLEQVKELAGAGADAFIIETMMDMNEALCAVRACKENFRDIPVIVSMTYATEKDGGRTQMGHKATDCAAAFEAAGADVVSTNCGDLSPAQVATIVKSYRSACSLPILAMPNAGQPRLDGDRTVYDMAPEAFAAGVKACVDAGAKLVGGCCGTSPAHIAALAKMAQSL